jgi:RecG-like helicase
MQNNFMLFSELQKQLSPSPIKTWRLLKQLRDEGRMRESEDWVMQDRKLFVNVPRFIVELEELGYANLKSNDFRSGDMKSDEITELAKELKLISSEITESRIQEEMKSSDFTADDSKAKVEQRDEPVKSTHNDLKSSDFTQISSEIINTKNELIDVLKESVSSREQDITQLRAVISELAQQNKTLTHQNGWLTNLLVAPKQETEPLRSTHVNVTDVTDENTTEEEPHEQERAEDFGADVQERADS